MAASPGALVPRLFQQAVTERALASNVLVRADTGSGKTLIAIMLMRQVTAAPRPAGVTAAPQPAGRAELKRITPAPPPAGCTEAKRLIVFLTPTTTLVHQQALVVEEQTLLKVKSFIGAQGVDFWKRQRWQEELAAADVVVLTPQIFLNVLTNAYFDLRDVDLLVFDEAHHAQKSHPYALIMRSHYHPLKERSEPVPRILGLTASPIWNVKKPQEAVRNLESTLDVRILEVAKAHRSEMASISPHALETLVEHDPLTAQQMALPPIFHQLTSELAVVWAADGRARDRIENAQILFGAAGVEVFLRHLVDEHKLSSSHLDSLKALTREPTTTSALSPKARVLVDILEDFRDEPTFHAIIFVGQRHHALVLAEVLKRIPALESFVRPAALVGHVGRVWHTTSEGVAAKDIGMAVKEQQATVAAFREGEVNLLVATRVAEEGLDVPSCHLVIRFDPLTTITGYVQSRGRARAAHARYIVIAEKGSPDASRYRSYVKQEQDLLDMYAAQPEEDDDSREPDLDNLPTYATSTGALLTHASSVPLIAQFCQLLRFDAFTPLQKPEYSVEGFGMSWRATLQVPRTAALEKNIFTSQVMQSKKAARQNASFQAAIALHQAGALDDYLLPIRETKAVGAKDADGRTVDTDTAPRHLDYSLVQPFGNVWTADVAILHVLEIERSSGTTRLGLVCGTRMYAVPVTTLYEPDGTQMSVRVVDVREVRCSDEAERSRGLAQLDEFNRDCTRVMLNRRIDDERFYALWAPVTATGEIDWQLVEHAFAPFDGETARPDDLVVVPFRRPNARIGFFERVRDDVNTGSPTAQVELNPPSRKRKVIENSHYPAYMKVCWAHSLPSDSFQPIVQFKPLNCQPYNALVPPEKRATLPPKEHHTSRCFPASMFRQTSIPATFFHCFSLVPSLNRLVGARTAATMVIERFSLPAIDLALLDEALTSPAAAVGWDYQKLEHVGDSPLKFLTSIHAYLQYPRADEDRLTRLRENSVDNRFLRQQSRVSGLAAYILPHRLRTSNFVPETSDDATVAADGLTVTKRLPRRLLSDTVEATLGAALLTNATETTTAAGAPALKIADDGLDRVLQVGDRLGLCFGGATPWHERPSARKLLDVPQQAAGIAFRPLEAALGYTFETQGALLVQALTHRSWAGQNVFCYEREEYLGDALLDTWATVRLIERYPRGTPRILTFCRALLVSNGVLAALAVRKLALHKVILHSSPALEAAMKDAAQQAEAFEWRDVVDGDLTFLWSPPKVLGDVVEAILAVIFIDCGMRVEPVFAVLDKLYADIMPHLRFEGVRDPYSRLLQWKDAAACTELAVTIMRHPATPALAPAPLLRSTHTHSSPAEQYTAQWTSHGRALATRQSESKAVARQLAAREALAVLEREGACGCREAARRAKEEAAAERETESEEAVEEESEETEEARPFPVEKEDEDTDEQEQGEEAMAIEGAEEPEALLRVREY